IIVLPMLLFTIVLLLPFIESWITGDTRDHHLLQRPRDAPGRTATMVALMTIYAVFWIAGGNDIIAIRLHLSINQITYCNRAAVFILPVITFWITKRWCISLQRKDRDDLLHGYETGIIMCSPEGGDTERHRPLPPERVLPCTAPVPLPPARAFRLTARDRGPDVLGELAGGPDANGVEPPSGIGARLAGV